MRRGAFVLLLLDTTAADHYHTLSVPRKATQDDVKAAYRRLARIHHPDKPDGCHEKFRKINEANEVLSSPQRRREYDARLDNPFAQARTTGGFPSAPGYSHPFANDPRFEAFFAKQKARQELKPVSPAVRIFACDLHELDSGCVKTITLQDTVLSRLRDAISEGRSGRAAQVTLQAAQQAALLAVSLMLRGYGNLLFGWGRWWLRVPLLVAAFAAYVGQQLPPSPEGVFDIRVRPGWRDAAASTSDTPNSPRPTNTHARAPGHAAAPPEQHTGLLAHRRGHKGHIRARGAARHLPAARDGAARGGAEAGRPRLHRAADAGGGGARRDARRAAAQRRGVERGAPAGRGA